MVVIDEGDSGKAREAVLMDLIYESTGTRIPLDKIKFGTPKMVDKRKDLKYDPNTFITVKVDSRYDSRYSASTSGIMYRRRSITEHIAGLNMQAVAPTALPFKITDILDQINTIVPYEFHPEEIVNHEYKTLADVELGIKLEAKPSALLWIDGKTIHVNTGLIGGSALVNTTNLDGFNEYVW